MPDPLLAEARVLVLGASGFIGSWVCRAAARSGALLTAVARNPDALTRTLQRYQVTAEAVGADLATPESGGALVERFRPTCVMNLVGYGVDRDERDAALTQRLNSDLVEELGETLAGMESQLPPWPGSRLVHVGSAFEYGSVAGRVTEDTPCKPTTSYGQSKLEGTLRLSEVVRRTGLRGVTLRVATVYGPGEHPHRLLPTLIRAATSDERISLTAGQQERDFTYVEDIAEGVVRSAASPKTPDSVLNMATGQLQTVRFFASCARDMLGIPAERVVFGAIPYRDDEVWQGEIEVGRLESFLQWRPAITVSDGIQRTIEWERNGRSDGDES